MVENEELIKIWQDKTPSPQLNQNSEGLISNILRQNSIFNHNSPQFPVNIIDKKFVAEFILEIEFAKTTDQNRSLLQRVIARLHKKNSLVRVQINSLSVIECKIRKTFLSKFIEQIKILVVNHDDFPSFKHEFHNRDSLSINLNISSQKNKNELTASGSNPDSRILSNQAGEVIVTLFVFFSYIVLVLNLFAGFKSSISSRSPKPAQLSRPKSINWKESIMALEIQQKNSVTEIICQGLEQKTAKDYDIPDLAKRYRSEKFAYCATFMTLFPLNESKYFCKLCKQRKDVKIIAVKE